MRNNSCLVPNDTFKLSLEFSSCLMAGLYDGPCDSSLGLQTDEMWASQHTHFIHNVEFTAQPLDGAPDFQELNS